MSLDTDDIDDLLDRAWRTRRNGGDARDDLDLAIRTARGANDSTRLAEALHRRAHVATDEADFAHAETLWVEAVELLRRRGTELELAHKLRHLAALHGELGNSQRARGMFDEVMDLYRSAQLDPPLDHANAAGAYANALESFGDHTAAAALWIEARDLYALIPLEEGVSMCLSGLLRCEKH